MKAFVLSLVFTVSIAFAGDEIIFPRRQMLKICAAKVLVPFLPGEPRSAQLILPSDAEPVDHLGLQVVGTMIQFLTSGSKQSEFQDLAWSNLSESRAYSFDYPFAFEGNELRLQGKFVLGRDESGVPGIFIENHSILLVFAPGAESIESQRARARLQAVLTRAVAHLKSELELRN